MAFGSENVICRQQLSTQYHVQQRQPPRDVLRTRNVNHQRSIAPAPYTKSLAQHSMLNGTTLDSNNPAVIRRNARERSRVKQVNNGFFTLRQHIPTAIIAEISNGRRGIGPGADKKLSKVDTLRMAAEYIRRLKKLIDEVDNSDASSVSSYETTATSPISSHACSISNSSPPPQFSLYNSSNSGNNNYYQQSQENAGQTSLQYCSPLSYPYSFEQHNLISPANSCASNESNRFHHSPNHYQSSDQSTFVLNTPKTTPIKMEPTFSFDDYHHNNTSSSSISTDDEELLDYISLWQEQ